MPDFPCTQIVSPYAGKMLEGVRWCSVLTQLKASLIMAEQPVGAGHYYGVPMVEQDMDYRLNWI